MDTVVTWMEQQLKAVGFWTLLGHFHPISVKLLGVQNFLRCLKSDHKTETFHKYLLHRVPKVSNDLLRSTNPLTITKTATLCRISVLSTNTILIQLA